MLATVSPRNTSLAEKIVIVCLPLSRCSYWARAIFNIVVEQCSYPSRARKSSITAARGAGSIKVKIDEPLRGHAIRISVGAGLRTESI